VRAPAVTHDGRVAAEPPRGLRRDGAPVVERTAAVTVLAERRFVGVDDDLVPLAARPLVAGTRQCGVRHGDERFRGRRLPRGPRFRGTAPQRIAHRLERTKDERAVLGREPPVDLQGPVCAPEHAELRVLLLLSRLLRRHPPVGAHRPLEL
jgi:hypothetical protein